jgi:hypothetical protein
MVNQNNKGEDMDVADLIASMKNSRVDQDNEDEEGSDVEEDNDEGMGDVDLNEEVADAHSDDEEEEKKE